MSNIANPTLESDVAMRMTMNAGLRSKPGRGSLEAVVGSRFNSLAKSSAGFQTPFDPEHCLPALRGFGKRILKTRGA